MKKPQFGTLKLFGLYFYAAIFGLALRDGVHIAEAAYVVFAMAISWELLKAIHQCGKSNRAH